MNDKKIGMYILKYIKNELCFNNVNNKVMIIKEEFLKDVYQYLIIDCGLNISILNIEKEISKSFELKIIIDNISLLEKEIYIIDYIQYKKRVMNV